MLNCYGYDASDEATANIPSCHTATRAGPLTSPEELTYLLHATLAPRPSRRFIK